jgi:GH15 family glucan-1,4-alpha-glucosidase
MLNGWWGLALIAQGRRDEATEVLTALHEANQQHLLDDDEWPFFEYLHAFTGEPGGTQRLAWSAAGAILLEHGLRGEMPWLGE